METTHLLLEFTSFQELKAAKEKNQVEFLKCKAQIENIEHKWDDLTVAQRSALVQPLKRITEEINSTSSKVLNLSLAITEKNSMALLRSDTNSGASVIDNIFDKLRALGNISNLPSGGHNHNMPMAEEKVCLVGFDLYGMDDYAGGPVPPMYTVAYLGASDIAVMDADEFGRNREQYSDWTIIRRECEEDIKSVLKSWVARKESAIDTSIRLEELRSKIDDNDIEEPMAAIIAMNEAGAVEEANEAGDLVQATKAATDGRVKEKEEQAVKQGPNDSDIQQDKKRKADDMAEMSSSESELDM